jgi:hypothetical protein
MEYGRNTPMMVVHKVIKTEFNDIEVKILHEAFEMCPASKFPGSSKDKDIRSFEEKVYRDDFMAFKEDLQIYINYLGSRRFHEHKEMHDHKNNKGRGYNGKAVKLREKDPDLILKVLKYYKENKKLEVKPDNLIDGIGQIYKQDVDKLYEEMIKVKDAMKLWRIRDIVYEP